MYLNNNKFDTVANGIVKAMKNLNWETLDTLDNYLGVEKQFIAFHAEKLILALEFNCGVKSKRKGSENMLYVHNAYVSFLNLKKESRRIDKSINGRTYDLVSYDKSNNEYRVEWKNSYAYSADESEIYSTDFWFTMSRRYPGAILRKITMNSRTVASIMSTWSIDIPKELQEQFEELVQIAVVARSEDREIELSEKDITTEMMLDLMIRREAIKPEYDYTIDFKKCSNEEVNKDRIIEEILKNVSEPYRFAQRNAMDPKDIGKFIKSDPNGISSFNRDDDEIGHKRLPRVSTTLPDREYIEMDKWGVESDVIFKYFDTFDKVFEDGREKRIIYEVGAEETLKKYRANLNEVEKHNKRLREFNLVFALVSSLRKDDQEGIVDALTNYRATNPTEDTSIEKAIDQLIDPKKGKEARMKVLSELIKTIKEETESETGLKLDSAGEFMLNTESIKLKSKREKKKSEMRPKVGAILMDYEEAIREGVEVDNHEQGVDRNWQFMLNERAYGNDTLNNLSNELLKRGSDRLQEIADSSYYGIAFQHMMYLKDIIASGNVGGAKSTNGFRIIKHRERGFYTLKTNDTSKITTGTMWNFGAFKGSERFNPIYGDFEYEEIDGMTYFVSKPFTMSIKILEKPFFFFTSWVATMLVMTDEMEWGEREELLDENVLLHSLFWDYNANIRHLTTVISFLYKLPLASGFFGEEEMAGRVDKWVIKDSRMATGMFRIKENWSQFVEEYRNRKEENKEFRDITDLVKGLKDPVFRFPHKSALTMNNVAFLKNITLKNDGVDEQRFLAMQYPVERKHYTEDYLQSEVVQMWKRYQEGEVYENFSTQFETFVDHLFKSKDEKPRWAAVSYYPEIIDVMTHDLYQELEGRNPTLKSDIRRWINEGAISSEKQSKVNLFDSRYTEELMTNYAKENKLNEVQIDDKFIEYCASKNAYVGMRSFDLPTAMKLEIKRMSDFLREVTKDSNRPFYGFDKGPKLLHLAMFGLIRYNKSCVVTQHMKEQVTDLRVFFMQEITMRNANRIIDKMHAPILNRVDEDLIMKKGDRKLIHIEGMKDKVQTTCEYPMIVSCDQKRYGDTYPVESLMIKLNVMFERGIINRPEYVIFRKCLLLIKNRYVLLNPLIRSFMNKLEIKEIDPLISLSKQSREIAGELKVIFSDVIDKTDFWSETDSGLMMLLTSNKGLKKGVGWILGVMNMFSSVDTTLHLKTAIDCVKYLILGDNLITGGTHSDDEIIITGLPSITIEDMKGRNRLIESMPEIIRNRIKFSISNNEMLPTTGNKNLKFSLKDLSGLVLTLSIFTPRLYGQRPSLAKWVWGDSGEVLQTTVQNGCSTQPISKWATVFARELPFISPGADLQHMIAQVMPALKHGASECLMTSLLILVNKSLNFIYPDIPRRLDVPPEIGGIWWSIPSLIKESGFAANEIRLYTLNEFSRSVIKTMSKTSGLWKIGNQEEQDGGSFEVHSRVDLQMVFSVFTTTDKNIQELVHRLELESKIVDEDEDFYKSLKSYLSTTKATRLKQGKNVDNATLNYLSRAYSPAFQRKMFGLKANKAIIATLGYYRRSFKNPFKIQEIEDYPTVTFEEWRDIIIERAANSPSTENKNQINLFAKIYQNDIIMHTNFMIDEFKIKETRDRAGWLFKAKYQEIRATREGYYPEFAKCVILTCSDLIGDLDPYLSIEDRIRSTETYLYNHETCEESGFTTAVETWMENFNKLGLTSKDIISVYDFLVSVLSSTYALDIIKRVNKNTHVIIDSLENMFNNTETVVFNKDKFYIKITENESEKEKINSEELIISSNAKNLINENRDTERILAINGWVKELNNLRNGDTVIQVSNILELNEVEVVNKYKDLQLKDLGEGFYELSRKTTASKNRMLLREIVLNSHNKENESAHLELYRGIINMKKWEGKTDIRLHVFNITMYKRVNLQLIVENYREEEEKQSKHWILMGSLDNDQGLPREEDYKLAGPLLEILQYFLVNKPLRVFITHPKVEFNSLFDVTEGVERVFRWPEGFTRIKNSELIPTKLHSGIYAPLGILQKAEIQDNGMQFKTNYEIINIDEKGYEVTKSRRPTMASYLVTPWIKKERELKFVIKNRETQVQLYSDTRRIISEGVNLKSVQDVILNRWGFLTTERYKDLSVTNKVNIMSIINNYMISLESLSQIKMSMDNGAYGVNAFTGSTFEAFVNRLIKSALEFSKDEHNEANAVKCQLNAIEILGHYRTSLLEFTYPKEKDLIGLNKEWAESLKAIIPDFVKIKPNTTLDFQAGMEVARGRTETYILRDGKYYRKNRRLMDEIKPGVMLISKQEYIKHLFEGKVGVYKEENKLEEKKKKNKVFSFINNKGNLPIELLKDLMSGLDKVEDSSLLLGISVSSPGMAWSRTGMRISPIIIEIIREMMGDNKPLERLLTLIDVIKY